MFSKLRLRKSIAYLLIWLQLLTPGLTLLPVLIHASEPTDMQNTIQGLNSLILDNKDPAQALSQSTTETTSRLDPSMQPGGLVSSSNLSDYFDIQPPVPVSPPILLPSLDSPEETSDDTPASLPQAENHSLASGAMQMGSILSQDNTTEAGINYARSIGEGLINQQVNDWLNQYGNAKVSLGSHQNLSGDLLVPLTETDQSLVFSQLGVRTHQDRNTLNLGFGYRQNVNDWMLGINTFYDYDYTGENKRIGVGTEAWTDYLKLAANGYLRQTNWHQSKVGDMNDYDERPANGFDLRANAYLPSWPNIGGSFKYEQYFGKGVSVAESVSPDSLKDNPVVVTAGIDYTPFPLMTLSAKRSAGDSKATHVGVDFTYRFGVPWLRQIDPDSVGLMRSLIGSKYDFVDRNYNIVMQYRKQTLLAISLPATVTAQAAETVPVVLTVSKAKYGLRSVTWNVDPLLTARGGHYQQISPTELQVRLPAYVFGQKTHAAQNYKISAIAADNYGNPSNTAETRIGVIPSENTVGRLTISPNDQALTANDNDSYTITGAVTDGKGAPLSNQNVTFSVDGLISSDGQAGTTLSPVGGGQGDSRSLVVITGLDGKATMTLRSKVAGKGQITATMDNGNASTEKVTFAADGSTEAVRKVTLMDDSTTKVADIKSAFTYTALVQDKFGNALANTSVAWAVDTGGVTLSATTTQTDSQGEASVQLQGGTRVVTDITVSAHTTLQTADIDANKKVSFIAGDIAAEKSTVTASPDSITANGEDASIITLTPVDANNNPIIGVASSLRATVTGLDNVRVSNFTEQGVGVYVATLTGTKAGTATLTILSGNRPASTQTPTVTLSADNATAQITDSNLLIVPDHSIADGKAQNGVKVTVTDKQSNPVSGMTVTFNVSSGAILTTVNGESDAQGVATATVTSTQAGSYTVTASVNGQSMTKEMTFVANVATAQVSKVALVGTASTLPANGQSHFSYTVTVVDDQGNPVSGMKVIPKADKAGVTTTANAITDNQGQTTIILNSSTLAVADVMVSAQVGSTQSTNADKTVSFIADTTTAHVHTLALAGTNNSKVADGKNTFTYTLTVKDSHDNLVTGATILHSVDKTGVTLAVSGITDASGQATLTLTSTTLAVADITVSAQVGTTPKVSASSTVSFIADSATAKVKAVILNDTVDNKVANGINGFTYTSQVVDAHDNPVKQAGITVNWSQNTGSEVILPSSSVTDVSGQTTISLISKNTAVSGIIVSAQVGTTPKVSASSAVSFIADSATAKVKAITLTDAVDYKVADGINGFTYTAQVVDAHDNPVKQAGITVNWSQNTGSVVILPSSSVTNASGQATITLLSTTTAVSGIIISAQVGETPKVSASTAVSFIADSTTANVQTVTLTDTLDNKVADGINGFTYMAQVVDGHDNPVKQAGITVSWSQNKGSSVILPSSSVTDASGQATIMLVSTTTAVSGIMVSAQIGTTPKVSVSTAVNFIADSTTAKIKTVILSDAVDNKVANGTNGFTYIAQVVDAHDNPVKEVGIPVSWSQNKGSAVILPPSSMTDASGQATITLGSTTSAVSGIIVSAQTDDTPTVSASTAVSFIADSTTAKVAVVTLPDAVVNKIANGTSSFIYTAQVVDAHDNPIKQTGITVSWSQNKGSGVILPSSSVTDASGQATITLVSTTSVVSGIIVSAQVGNTPAMPASTAVNFIADSGTAKVKMVTLTDTVVNKVADGANGFTYTTQVVDAYDNPVKKAGITVSWSQNKGSAVILPSSSMTDASGQATITLVSTTAAVSGIIVSAQVGTTPTVSASTAVGFIADSTTAKVKAVTLPDAVVNKVANGSSGFTYTAQVVDAHDNPVKQTGIVVSWSQNKGSEVILASSSMTDASGQATITLISKTVAVSGIVVSAQVGATPKVPASTAVNFIADRATAKVKTVTLPDAVDSKVANGINDFTYTAQLVDAHNNPVKQAGITVSWSQNKGSTVILPSSSMTDASGQATITLVSKTTAVSGIIVSAQVDATPQVSASTAVNFIADRATAKVKTVTLPDAVVNKVADGINDFTYTAQIVDSYDNPVKEAGITVSWSQNKGNAVILASSSVTDASGQATIKLVSTTTAVSGIIISAQVGATPKVPASTAVNFIADSTTAKVKAVTLPDAVVNKVANGINGFTYTAQVVDTHDNPVKQAGITVSWSQNKGSEVILPSSSVTDASGKATITLLSKTTAVSGIIVSAQVGTTPKVSASTPVNFIADRATAKVKAVTLTDTVDNKVANGTNSFTYTSQVIDGYGNPVKEAGITVSWSQNKGSAVILPSSSVTDASGQTTITLVSKTTAVSGIIVSAQVGTTPKVSASTAVSFIADISTATIKRVDIKNNNAKANGHDANQVVITVEDKQGNAVPNALMIITVPSTASYSTVPVNNMTDASGQLTVSITNTKAGSADYAFSTNNSSKTTTLIFDPDTATAELIAANFTIVTNNSTANGKAKNQVQAIIKDAKGNLVPKVNIVFTTNNGATPATQVLASDNSGQAIFTLTNTQAGTTQVKAYLEGQSDKTAVSLNVVFVAGETVGNTSSIKVGRNSYVVETEMLVTVTLKDAQGNSITGKASSLTDTAITVPNTIAKVNSSWTDNNDGTYSRSYIAKKVATGLKASLKLAGWTTASESANYAIEADAASAIITASVLKNGNTLTPADGKASYDVLITAKDKFGNMLPSYSVELTSPVLTKPRVVSTSTDGTVKTAISSTLAGSNDVIITSTTNVSVKTSVTLKFSIATVNIVSPSL